MKLWVNKYLPLHGYVAMTFFNIILWREEYSYWIHNNDYFKRTYNHETIHEAQMKDLCPFIPIGGFLFYIIYLIEWLIKVLFIYPFDHYAYRNVSFEREAYTNEFNEDYLKCRKKFAWIHRIIK